MTKVQIRFKLENSLDDRALEQISDAHAIYGIEWIRLKPSMTELDVEYDATRLRPAEVEAALRMRGIPVARM